MPLGDLTTRADEVRACHLRVPDPTGTPWSWPRPGSATRAGRRTRVATSPCCVPESTKGYVWGVQSTDPAWTSEAAAAAGEMKPLAGGKRLRCRADRSAAADAGCTRPGQKADPPPKHRGGLAVAVRLLEILGRRADTGRVMVVVPAVSFAGGRHGEADQAEVAQVRQIAVGRLVERTVVHEDVVVNVRTEIVEEARRTARQSVHERVVPRATA
jgi:hypothetical protein